jgi:hypothetical protein
LLTGGRLAIDPPRFSANPAANPDPIVLLIVRLFSATPVADDGFVATKRTLAWQQIQRDSGHPGSVLSFVPRSAIKRIKAGVKACP